MPNPKKSAGASIPAESSLPFEAALQKLEAVVETMESQDLPLETLIKRYEEGVKLAHICQDKLGEAEVKIRQLEKSVTGELKLKTFAIDVES